jgi:A/G-specific adenine glycosylase
VRHSITNTNYYVTIYALEAGRRRMLKGEAERLRWVKVRELGELALTGLTRKVLKRSKLWPGFG